MKQLTAQQKRRDSFQRLRKIIVLAMLGALMFASKQLMEFLPNIHMIAMLIAVYTLVYRVWALIPIYVFAFLEGLLFGFAQWWYPYLYIWTVLWGAIMLVPQKMPNKIRIPICIGLCVLHGLLYGVLYAPLQAWMFGYSFKQMLAWIAIGFPWDVVHACGNLVLGLLLYSLYPALSKLEQKFSSL